MPEPTDISRVALITGAAGGLGHALVAEFAAQGWRVVSAHHSVPAHETAERVFSVPLDVTNRAQVREVFSQVLDRWGRLDMLINNAGVTDDALVTQMDEAAWDRVLDVNLKGAFLCSQAAIRPMMKQRDGHIINVTSFVARVGRAGQVSYAAAKAGLIGLTESLAKEVGSRNVRVNAILPGVLATPMTAKLTDEQRALISGENALGRINTVEEVARFAAHLAGTQNISGQLFQLDSRIARWC